MPLSKKDVHVPKEKCEKDLFSPSGIDRDIFSLFDIWGGYD